MVWWRDKEEKERRKEKEIIANHFSTIIET